jgi:hypothetical protein
MKHKKAGTTPTWVKLSINGEKLDVLRVWQLNPTGHKWPETAILRARTMGAKQQVEDDTILLPFLNANDIFSKDVNAILSRVSVAPGLLPCNPPHWNFVVFHGKASNTVVIEVPCFK